MGHRHAVVQVDLSPASSFWTSELRVNGCSNLSIGCPLHRNLDPNLDFTPPLVELGRGAIVCARNSDHLLVCQCHWCSLCIDNGCDIVLEDNLSLCELLEEEL